VLSPGSYDFDMYLNTTHRHNENIDKQKLKNLMNFFDGHHLDKVIIITTTNYPNDIEDALIRSGRLDYMINFDTLQTCELKMLLNRFYPNYIKDTDKIKHLKSTKISTFIHECVIPNLRDYKSCINMLKETY